MLKRVVLLLVLVVGGANVGGAEDAAEAIVADPPVGDSDGIVFLPVTPGGSIEIDGTTFGMPPGFCTRYSESLKAPAPDASDLLPPWSRPSHSVLGTRSA